MQWGLTKSFEIATNETNSVKTPIFKATWFSSPFEASAGGENTPNLKYKCILGCFRK